MKSYEKFITQIIYIKINVGFVVIDFLSKSLEETRKVATQRKAFNTVKKRQKENLARISNLTEKRDKLREARERCVGNKELLDLAIKNLEGNGFRVSLAETAEDAISHILREIGTEKTVVKAKSNTAREIDLTAELESAGIDVIETDMGDRILQISGETPSHPTGPLSHLTIQDISKYASRYFKKEVPPVAEELIELIKGDISEHLQRANIGITGANAIAAEEGAVLLIHNEGNILEVMMRPKKHIIVAGTDKIYPNLDEAMNMGKLQTFFATGSLIPSFINVIGGPSKTADIEKRLIKGLHGPKDICIIFIDNKRSEIIQKGFKELLYCIGCGSCLLHCPVYNFVGKKFGDSDNLGGRGVVYSAVLDGSETDGLSSCVTCSKCKKNCPVDLDIPTLVERLRKEHQKGNEFIESHLRLLRAAVRFEVLLLLSRVLRFREE